MVTTHYICQGQVPQLIQILFIKISLVSHSSRLPSIFLLLITLLAVTYINYVWIITYCFAHQAQQSIYDYIKPLNGHSMLDMGYLCGERQTQVYFVTFQLMLSKTQSHSWQHAGQSCQLFVQQHLEEQLYHSFRMYQILNVISYYFKIINKSCVLLKQMIQSSLPNNSTQKTNEIDMTSIIQSSLSVLPSYLHTKYSESIANYKNKVIPFQLSRIEENKNLLTKAQNLQNHKNDLQSKIKALGRIARRNQAKLQANLSKINDLERTISQLEKANNQNLSVVLVLKINKKQLQDQVQQCIKTLMQEEQSKKSILANYQKTNDEYNMLLSNYMKDKNIIAEKLNYMNDLQQKLFEKQKSVKEQETYLKQQWLQFQKQRQKQKQRPKIFKKNTQQNIMMKQSVKQVVIPAKIYERQQILQKPLKKIINYHKGQILSLSVNEKESIFATCSADRLIKTYRINQFSVLSTIQAIQQNNFLSLQISQKGDCIITGGTDKSVQIYDVKTGECLKKLIQHSMKVNSVSWCNSSHKCASGSEDKQIKIWDVQKGQCQTTFSCGKQVKYITCDKSDNLIYSGHSDGSFRLYSPSQQAPCSQIKGLIDFPITSIAAVPSNPSQFLLSSQQGSPIYLVDTKTNKCIHKYEAKDYFNKIGNVEVSQRFVIAGNCDGNIYYWNRDKKQFQKKISGHDYGISQIKYIRGKQQNMLVSCDCQGNIIIWH